MSKVVEENKGEDNRQTRTLEMELQAVKEQLALSDANFERIKVNC